MSKEKKETMDDLLKQGSECVKKLDLDNLKKNKNPNILIKKIFSDMDIIKKKMSRLYNKK